MHIYTSTFMRSFMPCGNIFPPLLASNVYHVKYTTYMRIVWPLSTRRDGKKVIQQVASIFKSSLFVGQRDGIGKRQQM